jgi:methyl-accepting chemotaxis protein
VTLLHMLVKREEQMTEGSKALEEKLGASIDEIVRTRRSELVDMLDQYTGHSKQLEEMRRKLIEWTQDQEQSMETIVDRTLAVTSPVAMASFRSMLSAFELDLQGLFNSQSLQYSQRAREEVTELASSIRQAHGTVEQWLESIQMKTSMTTSLIDTHRHQLRKVTQQSQDIGYGLSDVHKTLQDVHHQVEESLEALQQSKETSKETAQVISEAVLLLNATVHHRGGSHRKWDNLLHCIDLVLGDSGQSGIALIQVWLKRIVALYEISLRE